jgi:hypothetical protein
VPYRERFKNYLINLEQAESLPRESDFLLLLGVSSLWQVVSGYADVYSHAFVFKSGDPILNPAHVSLYLASLLGFVAVFLSLKTKRPVRSCGFRIGMLVASIGVVAEIAAGIVNELYHRVIADFYPSQTIHFSIHGSFVLAMMTVVVGGLLASTFYNVSGIHSKGRNLGGIYVGLFVSALWLLVLGSLAYVAGSRGVNAGPPYLVVGSFLASLVSNFGWRANGKFGVLTVAVFVYYSTTALLDYFLAGVNVLLPVSVGVALAIEIVWMKAAKFDLLLRSVVTGAMTGLLSYWLLYPYPYFFFGSYVPDLLLGPFIVLLVGAGAIGGAVSSGVSVKVAQLLYPREARLQVGTRQ